MGDRGKAEVAECADKRCLNRVLLITDGLAEVGVTDPEVIVSQAKGLYERGIATSTIGVGERLQRGSPRGHGQRGGRKQLVCGRTGGFPADFRNGDGGTASRDMLEGPHEDRTGRRSRAARCAERF